LLFELEKYNWNNENYYVNSKIVVSILGVITNEIVRKVIMTK
jgi:hypothetical protein